MATGGTTSLSYTYDADGLRLTKTVGDLRSQYIYADGKLMRLNIYRDSTRIHILDFFYDHNGHPYSLKHTTNIFLSLNTDKQPKSQISQLDRCNNS